MLQPGLASVTRDDGQSVIVPMDDAQAQAQGLTPEQPPGSVPSPMPAPPSGPNPYSMIGSGQAVAGPGGGPTDLGSGAGVFAQPAPPPDPRVVAQQLLTPQAVSHEARPESKFDVPMPGEAGAPPKPKLVQAGTGMKPPSGAAEQPGGMDPMFADYIARGGGGGGAPRGLAVTSETKKFKQAGPVDPALAADISQGQDQLDQATSNQLEDEALHKGDYLEQQGALMQERANAVKAQIAQRQAIDTEIQRLNAKSQQAQDELANSKPKQIDQFWRDKSMGTKLFTGVAVFLSGFNTRGDNSVMTQINTDIDKWVNDQRQQYEAAKDKATLSNNAYKDALSTYGSPELAQTNLQLQALAAKDALIKNTAEQIGTTDALGQAQLALQQSQLQRKQLAAQAQALNTVEVEQKLSMQGGGSGGDIFARIKKAAEAKQGLDYLGGKTDVHGKPIGSASDSPLAVRDINGNVLGVAGSGREKTEVQRAITAAGGAQEDIKRLQALTKDASSRSWGDEDAGRAKVLASALLVKAHDAQGMRTFQEATAKVMHDMLGDPAAFFRNPNSAAKLDELNRIMQDEVRLKRSGLAPAGRGASSGADTSEDDIPASAEEITE